MLRLAESFPPEEINSYALIDKLVRHEVHRAATFEDYVRSLPGVPPDEALAALLRLGDAHAQRLAKDARVDHAEPLVDQCSLLPLPHPLDSEFRFDGASAATLAEALIASTSEGDEILLVGVPTVAVRFAELDVDRRVRFLGPDNSVTAAVRAAFKNERLILGEGSGGTAKAALLDPPWYREPMCEMLGAVARGCKRGAIVRLVIPPLGTRPNAVQDREDYICTAQGLGMTRESGAQNVTYRTPLFELAVLERQGIARLPDWRSGEIVDLIAGEPPRTAAFWRPPRSTELTIGGVRLRAIASQTGGGSLLRALADEEVFPSVSSRAPGRENATLWTSTNRAFAVDAASLQAALAALASADVRVLHGRLEIGENDSVLNQGVATSRKLIHQLLELVERELGDARRLVGDGAWLETATEWRS